ncbi:MAG: UvrD-helicase domain-containing protein [Acidobacteriota bacterium]
MPRAPRPDALPDAEARQAIRTELDVTLLVEAGAGSGKTTMLVERMLALLLSGKANPENVAAVTFTRKAASHLRRRFQAALEETARTEKDPSRKAAAERARAALDRLTIGTIDSFCALLLAERPLEAGIDPAALRVELQEAQLFRQQAFREYIGQRADAGGAVGDLLALGVKMNELEESFELYAEYPDVEPVVSDPLALPDFRDMREGIEDFLRKAIPLVPAEPGPEGRDKLQTKLLEARDLIELPDFGTPAGFARLLRTLRPSGGATQKRWPDKALAKRLDLQFEALRSDVIKPALAEWQLALHERIYSVLKPALVFLEARRAGRGPFTYADLLLATRNLLRDYPGVRRAFAERFTHLLVDEFQDTDPLQAEILLYLAGSDGTEKDVARLVPKPGSLFVVGDPKQSIYRFRRADIASYVDFRRTLEAAGGKVLELTANFRAVPSLARAANEVFRELLPVDADERQAAFAPLDAVRVDHGPAAGGFRLPSTVEGNPEDVARFVRWAVDSAWPVASDGPVRGARYGDFLVLTRTREHIDAYARALEVYGVPVDVSGSRSLPISRGLQELRPFLAAIQDPDDGVSVVAFLSGPLCGVDDDALYAWRRAGGRFSYFGDPPPSGDARIVRGLRLLADSWKDVRAHGAGAAIGLIVERLGAIPRLAAGPEGRTASGNLLKVLALARRLSGNGLAFRDVVERLAEDAPALDLEEMSVEPIEADAVRLVNVHRAKGLEAPIVVLAELSAPARPNPKRHVARGRSGSRGWFTAGYYTRPPGRSPQWNVTAVPPDWDKRKSIEIAFEEAERVRVLYVAATRARDTLVVSLVADKPEKGAWATLRSVLRDLPPAAGDYAPAEPAPAPPLAARLREARREIAVSREAATNPTHAVVSVTALAKRQGPRAPTPAEQARGTAWGRVLHQLLEAAMRSPGLDMKPLARNLMREEEIESGLLDDVLRVVESVLGSELWARASGSAHRHVEVPFEMLVPSKELGLGEGPAETLLKGAMDLVFEEDGVWHIVDWKSDVVGDGLAGLVAHYAPQVRHYRRAWETLTKQKAKAGLFFMDTREIVWLGEEETIDRERGREEEISLKVKRADPAAEPRPDDAAPHQRSLFEES